MSGIAGDLAMATKMRALLATGDGKTQFILECKQSQLLILSRSHLSYLVNYRYEIY